MDRPGSHGTRPWSRGPPKCCRQGSEALAKRIGRLDDSFLLSHPLIMRLLYQLSYRSGATMFRHRLGPLIAEVRAVSDLADRAQVLEDRLDELIATAADATTHSITVDSLPRELGTTAERRAWLSWAESSGVLVRGVEVVCPTCGHNQWRTLAEFAPPVVCRGWESIAQPFRHDVLPFRYWASETVLRVMDTDALGHLLTLRWLNQLFRRGFDRAETLIGGHPGVEVCDRAGRILGEVDCLLLFSDGEIAVGEYKRNPTGLNQDEIDKLDRVADTLDAGSTSLATHALADSCPSFWQKCPDDGLDRPASCSPVTTCTGMPYGQSSGSPFTWPGTDGYPTTAQRPPPPRSRLHCSPKRNPTHRYIGCGTTTTGPTAPESALDLNEKRSVRGVPFIATPSPSDIRYGQLAADARRHRVTRAECCDARVSTTAT